MTGLRYPTARVLGFSWVGWLNFLVLQWLCVRLQGEVDLDDGATKWAFIGPVLPLTGWWSRYWPKKRREFPL